MDGYWKGVTALSPALYSSLVSNVTAVLTRRGLADGSVRVVGPALSQVTTGAIYKYSDYLKQLQQDPAWNQLAGLSVHTYGDF